MDESVYYTKYAAAYVRGMAQSNNVEKNLHELNENELEEIVSIGKAAGLKLYHFKNTHDDLPRVKRVLGFLKSIEMENLLDVGSGRGAFLWPCLNTFPHLNVLSVDILPHRVDMLKTVKKGGITNLESMEADICKIRIPDKSYDVVTALEVLEHIPEPSAAVHSIVRIAKKYVVVTVPSKPDNNPEHLHLLTKDVLTELFNKAGCTRLHFDGVHGHLFMAAIMES